MDISKIIQNAHSIGISGHVRPDGDCIGSTLGLYNYIKSNFKDAEVKLFLEEAPEVFHFLPGYSEICHTFEPSLKFDLYFALDCGDSARLGEFSRYFESASYRVCIDHHKSNQSYGDENYIFPNISSTSELVFELIGEKNITRDIAECLYTGIVHDTGVFQYNSTSSRTMEIAGFLMEQGITFSKIIDETFYKKTYNQNRILGKAIMEAKLYNNGSVIASTVTRKDMDAFGVKSADLDGIVNQLRIVKGVEVALFFYETEKDYKVSMRGNGKVDLSILAAMYGGGGHFMAAGFNSALDVEVLTQQLLEKISIQLKENEC